MTTPRYDDGSTPDRYEYPDAAGYPDGTGTLDEGVTAPAESAFDDVIAEFERFFGDTEY